MESIIISILLFVVGLINLLPALSCASKNKLEQQYGIEIQGNDLSILIKHRALMLGIIGGFVMCAAFFPPLQIAAFIISFISMMGFVIIAKMTGEHNQNIAKVSRVDIVASVLLLIAVLIYSVSHYAA